MAERVRCNYQTCFSRLCPQLAADTLNVKNVSILYTYISACVLLLSWHAELCSCYCIQSMTCICSVSISGAWYWHLGQHKSGSSSVPAAPWSPTGTKPWLRNEEAGGTVLKAGLGNTPKVKEKENNFLPETREENTSTCQQSIDAYYLKLYVVPQSWHINNI